MAKKVNRITYTPEVAPGADPNGGNVLLSRKMGNVMGCICLLVFILFKELWIGTLAFGIGFAVETERPHGKNGVRFTVQPPVDQVEVVGGFMNEHTARVFHHSVPTLKVIAAMYSV